MCDVQSIPHELWVIIFEYAIDSSSRHMRTAVAITLTCRWFRDIVSATATYGDVSAHMRAMCAQRPEDGVRIAQAIVCRAHAVAKIQLRRRVRVRDVQALIGAYIADVDGLRGNNLVTTIHAYADELAGVYCSAVDIACVPNTRRDPFRIVIGPAAISGSGIVGLTVIGCTGNVGTIRSRGNIGTVLMHATSSVRSSIPPVVFEMAEKICRMFIRFD